MSKSTLLTTNLTTTNTKQNQQAIENNKTNSKPIPNQKQNTPTYRQPQAKQQKKT